MADTTSTKDVSNEAKGSGVTADAPDSSSTGRRRRDGSSPAPATGGKGPRKGKQRPELTPELIEAATAGWERIITLGTIAAQMFVPAPFAPNDEEAAGIRAPLSRILGRHYPIPEIKGDAEDAFALVIAVSMYGARVFSDLAAGRSRPLPPSQPEPPRRHTERAAAPANGPVPDASMRPASEPVPADSVIRPATSGESVGVPPEQLVGPPDQVLDVLHRASYRPEAAAGVA